MLRRPVRSSNVASVAWEATPDGEGVLEIEFRSGHTYRYDGVPQSLYQEMLGANSVGRFFITRIQGQFEEERQ